jgi:hypothetical protein
MNRITQSATDLQLPPYDPALSSLLDLTAQREQAHDEEAMLHFMQWRYHLQEASTARAERRALEASVWADRQAA